MSTTTTTALVDALRQYGLLESAQMEEVIASLQSRFFDPKTLVKELVHRDWLTPFQANLLLQGNGQDLVLGAYILLEKLGQGGMGQVFKARNRKMGRIVAIKLIRQEKLDSLDAIRRFQREVRAAAQLNNPNVVRAYDADEVGGALLLVMEYVDGTDLSKLVKSSGPLPIPDACDFVRQAALGLQHAFEQGLVHRDIKPHNLLLTRDGTVKVLDMGLARLDSAMDNHPSTAMTQEGSILGTADYIAPEQAINAHTADIRADIYSLGCTFYYLLAGKVPFPDGFLTEKLLQHQFSEPYPIELHRPDVPPTVASIVRKMMAKKPENRYPLPAKVAEALASVSERTGIYSVAANIDESCQAVTAGEASGDTLDSAFGYMARVGDRPKLKISPQPINVPAGKRRWPFYCLGGLAILAALVAGLVLFQHRQLMDIVKEQPATKSVFLKIIPTWTVLEVETITSAGGATFTKQPDGSILVGGMNPPTDSYTLTAKTMLKGITGVRLEVLADPSLPVSGPGRTPNGNFVLNEFWVAVAKAGETPEKAKVVTLQNPLATFSQDNYLIAAAIDNDPQTGWAISPQFGKDHAAVFELEK